MFRVLKFCWKALCFIRDLVMNVVFLGFVLLLVTIISFSSGGKKSTTLTGEGALLVNLDGYLADNRDETLRWQDALSELNGEHVPRKISTFDVVFAIQQAEDDPKIKGLVLDLNYFEGADLPALDFIGSAISHFKDAGKSVIAYADNYSQGQYYLASFADEIYLNSIGSVDIHGLSQENLYFKEMLDKLAVTPHIFRVGTYKSAVEPFLRNDMSAEAKANMKRWLGEMWNNYVLSVSENRNIKKDNVLPNAKQYLAELKALKGNSTAYVQQRGLVTDVVTRLDLDKKLAALFGKGSDGKANLIEFDDYLTQLPDRLEHYNVPNKIAVVNVEGTIIDGESDEENAGGDTIARILRKAQDDNSVKAVVLRVNSPGGSAFASEIIRQETENLQKIGKPVIVSMGAMAASGGYWISSTADYIIADENTITGSIGIFAMFPTFENSIKKIGVSSDGVSTTELANTSAFSPLAKPVQDIYQTEIEHGYDRFLEIVSKGRQLSKTQVDKLAQGQVWLGSDAFQNGLVDEIGSFNEAVNKAEQLVNQRQDTAVQDFSVEWFTDDNVSLISTLLRDTKKGAQEQLAKWLGLPAPIQKLQKELNVLTKFNDPKGQYLYCLNCGKVQ
ncbi:TPA: signal peptide peptidase SppA [Haemophilus influenzae]|uniref:signal peptide peptidase SppA n=1 Tax=Haemophilus influenzae TaxID=727 RepID=UPI000D018F38|nr:signal peptide peptidase SppA [Haemophilus influenzae]MCK8804231.1 signal peptide peptidase SppA [Haemophilus influenzae]MCK8896312.1 signal peptide peptidase SppA [Haemophilus influenzae]MCK8971760.1 signal peptide peptidase SppA [Haemophilus influenzae]MCK8985635.1 signal peptide peptidase SppA [Haemophilus influenzae]MCK9074991.1 signal peptide peptidase SppA [Haemophilus influenzae]